MKACTACHEAKPLPDFYFHATRGRYEARCKDCFKARVKASADANREAVRAANRVAGSKFREANREYERVRTLAHYHANREERSAASARWRAENPDKHAAKEAKRRAAKLKATPPWADTEQIKLIYRRAQELKEQTGRDWHVDHIVPLKGKTVCGLHCEANLQILSAFDNLSKSARYWPDMP